MRATITVSGKQGSGKTRWLDQLKSVLLSTAPIEAVEVTTWEAEPEMGSRLSRNYMHDEFTIPAADSGTAEAAGDRETWSLYSVGAASTGVREGSIWRATFKDSDDAERFMRLMTARSGRYRAVLAALSGRSFYFDGETPIFSDGPILTTAWETPKSCKGGRGDSAEGAGVIPPNVYWDDAGGNFYNAIGHRGMGLPFYQRWAPRKREFPQSAEEARARKEALNSLFGKLSAAEAPAIHDCPPCDPLREAALALYNAGAWQLYGPTSLKPSQQEKLWTALRDALGLEPGTATAAGVAPKKSDDGYQVDPTSTFEKLVVGLRQVARDIIFETASTTWPKYRKENFYTYADRINGYAAELGLVRCPEATLEQTESENYDFAITQLAHAHDVLQIVAEVFDGYGDHHAQKAHPFAKLKALRNWRYARLCRSVIPTFDEPEEIQEAAE